MRIALSSNRMYSSGWLAGVMLLLVSVAPSHAQESRAEALTRQRAEKASQLEAYQPQKLEKALLWIEDFDPLTRIAPYNGFYVQYGYTAKPVGSGMAIGAGWRHDLLDRNARVTVEAGRSTRGYHLLRADFSLPRLLDERFELGVEATRRWHPQEDFYGLGFGTTRASRVSFSLRAPDVQGRAVFKPRESLNAGVRVGRTRVTAGPGTDTRFPSIEALFDEAAAPGIDDRVSYTYADVFATVDTRDQPGNPRDGLYLGAAWRRYDDRDRGRFDFDRVEVEAQHFLPIYDKKRVFAARLHVMSTTAGDGHDVPFYFRPTVGGSNSLRSAADFRFRDRHAAVMNFEYRWEAFSGLDMALFSDFATVAPRFRALEFSRIRGAYGIGLRFNTYKAVFLRLDVAAGGSEGIRTFLKFSNVF
jgi:outer membrane protein assembly factor BamA